MSKKSFKDDNPALAFINKNTEQVKGQLEVTTDAEIKETQYKQDVQEEQEKQGTYEEQSTQGRKGQKLQRINMAFSDENIEYLRLISRLEGVSMTQYVNTLLEADREDRAELVEKAKELLK